MEENDSGTGGTYLSVKEIAELLNVSERTIRNYIKAGKLTMEKVPFPGGFRYRVSRESLENFDGKTSTLSRGVESGFNGKFPGVSSSGEVETISYKALYEKLEEKHNILEAELRNKSEFIGALQERLNNERKLLTDRAQSLIEKEAQVIEYKAGIQERESKIREIEDTARAEIERIRQEFKQEQDIRAKMEAELKKPWWKRLFRK